MTFIKRQSVAFNILNNVGPDSTAEYIEKGKRGQIGEIRTWSDGKYRKTASGWEPVKESLQASSEEKEVDLKEEKKRVEGKNGFTDLDGVWHYSSNPKEDVRYKKKMSEEGRKAFEKEYAQPGSEAAEEQEYDSLLSKLESKVGRGISDILDSSSKEDLKDLLHEEHNLKYSDEQISKIFNMSKKLKADSHFKVNGLTYKQIVGEDSKKKEPETIEKDGKKYKLQPNGKYLEISEHGLTKEQHEAKKRKYLIDEDDARDAHIEAYSKRYPHADRLHKEHMEAMKNRVLHQDMAKKLSDKEFTKEELEDKGSFEKDGKKYKLQPNGKYLEVSELGMTKEQHRFKEATHNTMKTKVQHYAVHHEETEEKKHRDLANKLSDKEFTKEELKGDRRENGYIVDNVNNGEIINSLFKEWNSIKTSEQHEKWAERVANTKFGTYKDKTILNVMNNFNPKFPNEILKRDFINEVQEAYKNSGWK